MKKSIKIFALLAAGALLANACNPSLLDIPQQGVQSEDNSYITDEDCEAATAAVYIAWRHAWSGAGTHYVNGFWFKNLLADEFHSEHTNQNEVANSTLTPNSQWVEAYYESLFKTVYAANLVLDKFSPESEIKARDIAEAKFFRAVAYYDLITLWGEVPLVDHVLAPDEYSIGPSSYADLWQFVETDLNDAIQSGKLVSKKSMDDKDTGTRITVEAAWAMLGKAYLTQKKFSEAHTAFSKVITSGKYGLIDNMGDLYHTQANGCKEYIFENVRKWDTNNLYGQDGWYGLEENWLFGYGITAADDAPYPFVTLMGWGAMTPTRKVYDAFVAEEGAKSPRRLASVLGMDDLPDFKVTVPATISWPGNEGVFRLKWLMTPTDEVANAWTGRLNNTPCMRYADVLLMAAEASVQGGGGNADAYVNEVRARVGLAPKSGVTLADVKKERQLELCFEATRFQDLKRWGDLATELADKGKRIPQLLAGAVTYTDNPDPAAGWQAHEQLLPFPQVELDTNPNLTQNEGY